MTSMPIKITILIAAILSFITGSCSSEAAPSPYGVPSREIAPSSRPQYAYAYDVRDPYSGSYTSKKETREGDVVYGNYVIEDAGGSRQTVYYVADPVRPFNAEVGRQRGPQQLRDKVQPIPVPIPVLPIVQTYVAPPPPPLEHQVRVGTPVAFSLAPAILTRPPSNYDAPQYHTSLTSPTHSYSY